MLKITSFDTLAVRAAFVALIVTYSRTAKGRRKMDEAIALLQSHVIRRAVVPLTKKGPAIGREREILEDGVLFLELIREMMDAE
jgi:hypothetical protein